MKIRPWKYLQTQQAYIFGPENFIFILFCFIIFFIVIKLHNMGQASLEVSTILLPQVPRELEIDRYEP